MIEESVSLNFEGKGIDEIEARLTQAFDRAMERAGRGSGAASVGGAGAPGGGTPGGGSGGVNLGGSAGGSSAAGGGGGNPLTQLITAGITGAGQGLGNLTPATVNSPEIAMREAGLGAAKGLITTAASVVGGAVGSLGGPVGTAIGAAAGNALGSYAEAQFNQLSESIHRPEDRTAARLAAYTGTLEAHGIHVSDKFLQQQARLGISIERRRLDGERRAERIAKETGVHMNSTAWGVSRLGR